MLALTYYLLFWCPWPVSEVDRVPTQEAWVAVASCQQAYDCSNEGTSDRELPARVHVSSESSGGSRHAIHKISLSVLGVPPTSICHTVLTRISPTNTQFWNLVRTNL